VDAAEQLYLALQHAGRRFRELDEELGLSPARFSLLATLRYHGPLRVGELAREERVAQPTITQSVQGLESAGLVRRGPHPSDGRGSVVELTPAGRALVRRARGRKIAWLSEALGELGDHQREALLAAAARLDRWSLTPG
jgi:DNA-binding MarR family transcriptional regulator